MGLQTYVSIAKISAKIESNIKTINTYKVVQKTAQS